MVEYYEGFLMAVDSLKRTGVSLDLYVYDSGKDISTLNTILAKNEMKSMNIIIGPMHQNQIKPLSDFAEKNDIRLVIPFSQKGEEVFKNPAIYQINTPQSYLYSEVYEHFTRQFPNANVIFIEPSSADKEKAEFISGLKQELKSKGIPMRTVSESATKETLKATLRSDKENIFIPTSGSNVLLIKVLPQLTLLVRENPAEKFTCSATRNGRLTPEIIWKISLSWMYISTLHSIRIHCFRQPCNSPTLIINGIVKIWQANTPITQCLASTPVSSS